MTTPRFFKPSIPSVILLSFTWFATAKAEIIGFDSFSYAVPTPTGANGGVFWDYKNTAPVGHGFVPSSWQPAPGLGGASAFSGGQLFTGDSGVMRNYTGIPEINGAVNASTLATSVYYRVKMTRGTGTTWCGLSSFDGGTERLFFGLYPGGTKFGIFNQTTFSPYIVSGVNVNVGETYTVVVKIDFLNDNLALFVNPDLAQSEGASTPAVLWTSPFTGVASTRIRLASGGTGLTAWDDLTVATSWNSLRDYKVTNGSDGFLASGSLRTVVAQAATAGGRVTFSAFENAGKGFALSNARLLRFSLDAPGVIEQDLPITGLVGGSALRGIDFNPADGRLYGLGILVGPAAADDEGRIYTIDPATARATVVAAVPFKHNFGVNANYGMDIAPSGEIRIITSSDNDNLRVSATTGLLLGTETPLGPFGGFPFISGIAYDTRLPGTLYGMSHVGSKLYRIGGPGGSPSPNGGTTTVIADLGAQVQFYNGFDIADDGTAYFTASKDFLPNSLLFRADLATGSTTELGSFGRGVEGLAIAPSGIFLNSEISLNAFRGVIIDGPETGGVTLVAAPVTFAPIPIGGSRHFNFGANSTVILRNLTLANGFKFTLGGSADGGSILSSGLLGIQRCTFVNNNCYGGGGAISASGGGRINVERSTFSGNQSYYGGALNLNSITSTLTHCTFNGNLTISGAPNPTGGGGIHADSSSITLEGCLVAGNFSQGGTGPDLRIIGTAPTATGNVIGDGESSQVSVSVANRNIVGIRSNPVKPLLAPLALYGGPTATMPPLPNSQAVDRSLTTNFSGDQRGQSLLNSPDAGATEYRGGADLERFWLTDWDNDGLTYGLERATGSDPFVNSPQPLTILKNAANEPQPRFGRDLSPGVTGTTRWILSRAPNLKAPWEAIYTFNGPGNTTTLAPGITAINPFPVGGVISVTDQLPNPRKNFYRLEAVLVR